MHGARVGTTIDRYAKILYFTSFLWPNCKYYGPSNIASDQGGIVIGDDTMIGPNCTVLAANYRYDRLDIPIHRQEVVSKGIHIGKDVWVGVGTVVMDGVEIGDGSIISPNSVVTTNISPLAIAQGNPAREIFKRR